MKAASRWAASAAIAALLACTGAVHAQKLLAPFTSLTTGAALKAAQAALAQCDKEGYTAAVTVVDRGGHALVVLRNALAGAHTVRTATDKAWTALSFRTDTLELTALTQSGRTQSGLRELPRVVAIGGGMMIRAKGSLVGAIGVSGAPGGEADEACAKAGIAAISDDLELE